MDNSPAPSLDHEIEDQDDGDESLDMENNGELILEQDRFLPIANVSRIMKRMIPSSGKMSKESKECVQECVSEFISFITSEASERCYQEKRKTITYEDLLSAMQSLGFDNYIEPLTIYMDRFHEVDKTGRVSSAPSNAGSVPPSPAMPVNKHAVQQDDRSQGHHEQSASHSQHQHQQYQHHNMHHTGHHEQVGVVNMDEHQQQQQAHHSQQPRAGQYVAGGGGKMQAMQQHHQMVEDVMDRGEQEVGGDGEEEQLQPHASQNVHQIQQVPIYVDPSSGQHYMVMSNPEGGGDILMQIQITSDGNAQPIQLVDGDAQMVDMRDDEMAAGEQGEVLEEAAALQPPPPLIPSSQPTPTHETSSKKHRFHYY